MSKYRNNAFYEELEENLKKLEQKQSEEATAEEVEIPDDRPRTVEEQTWQKRYADLRRHEQDQARKYKEQIDKLQSQLKTTVEEQTSFPSSEDEVEEWSKKFPHVYKIIQTMILKEATKVAAQGDERFKTIEERERQAAYEAEYNKLLKKHPDFDEIRVTDEFRDWVASKPKAFTAPLWSNDGLAAAEVITLYKKETQISQEQPRKRNDGAAHTVPRGTRGEPEGNKDKNLVYESDLEKMDHVQRAQRFDEINKAINEGRFVYDVSAA